VTGLRLVVAVLALAAALIAPAAAQHDHSHESPPAAAAGAELPADHLAETLGLLREGFVQQALKAGLLVGVVCAYLGVFVVLKRIVFVGAALANVASLGAALAFTPPALALMTWIVDRVPALEPLAHFKPLILALLLMLLSVAFFSQHRLGRRLPRESVIGAAYAGAAGLTLVILAKVQSHGQHALDVLQGNILGVESQEVVELAVAAVVVGVILALFHKEFVLVSFDPEVARTLGYQSSRWELLWYLSLGVMIAVSIHVAGTVLVFSHLVIPPVTALLLSRRLTVVLALSVGFAVLATLLGLLISVSPVFDIPTTPCIVAVSCGFYGLAWVARTLLGFSRN
jgi:ABC-type Mn2+/Zn2+ transport system permease subunit